jgi:hypothetical protein
MRAYIFLVGISVFPLCACSSLGSLMTFGDDPAEIAAAPEAVPASPPAAPQGPEDWCKGVAASDRNRGQQAGFDAATLDRMAAASYRQCIDLGIAR